MVYVKGERYGQKIRAAARFVYPWKAAKTAYKRDQMMKVLYNPQMKPCVSSSNFLLMLGTVSYQLFCQSTWLSLMGVGAIHGG